MGVGHRLQNRDVCKFVFIEVVSGVSHGIVVTPPTRLAGANCEPNRSDWIRLLYSGLHQTCNFGSRHPSKCACAHFTTNSFSPEYGRYVV